MKLTEFKQRLHIHDDIPFTYGGREYVILGWYEGGPLLCDCLDETRNQQFKDSKDLLDNCFIDGVNIKQLIDEV